MANFSVWIETTRAGNFQIRTQEANGKRETFCTIDKDQKAELKDLYPPHEMKWYQGKALAKRMVSEAKNNRLKNATATVIPEEYDKLVREWENDLERERRSPRTIVSYQKGLASFTEYAHPKTQTDITPEMAENFRDDLQDRGYADGSVHIRIASLRAFCKWLMKKKKLTAMPIPPGLAKPPKGEDPKFWHSEEFEALDAVLAKLSPATRLAMNFAHDAGMRLCEIAGHQGESEGVRWEDITWYPATEEEPEGVAEITLRPEIVKGGKRGRTIPLSPGLVSLLGSRGSGPIIKLTRDQVAHYFKRAREICGPEKVRQDRDIHGLRHTFAKNYLQDGNGNLASLKELMGHEDISTTQIYAKFEKRYFREGVNLAHRRRLEKRALAGTLQGDFQGIKPIIANPGHSVPQVIESNKKSKLVDNSPKMKSSSV